jgi:hypothetical protein
LSNSAVCASPAVKTLTGITELEDKEPPLAVTVIVPEPLAAEVGTIDRITAVGFEETDTVVGVVEQLTPVTDELQPMFTDPVKPPNPETAQVRVSVEGVSFGSIRMAKGSLSHTRLRSGPSAGVTVVHADDGPKHDSAGPMGITM